MPHEELLAKLDDHPCVYGSTLRAVLELHKPDDSGKYCQAHDQCWGCGEWGNIEGCPCNSYPCETIKAIQRVLA